MAEKLVTYWFVLVDGKTPGPAGDYTHIMRFGGKGAEKRAKDLASRSTCWGRPTEAKEDQVPRKLAQRWGIV